MFNYTEYITENPDNLKLPTGEILTVSRWDSKAFGYPKGDFKDNRGELHKVNIMWTSSIFSHYKVGIPVGGTEKVMRDFFKYAGRVWLDAKVISFWYYPPKEEMPKIIKDLEDNLNIKINPKEWLIEIVMGDIDYIPDSSFGVRWSNKDNETKIITLSEYEGSGERSEKDLATQHILSPLLKSKRKVTSKKNDIRIKGYKYQENLKTFNNFQN